MKFGKDNRQVRNNVCFFPSVLSWKSCLVTPRQNTLQKKKEPEIAVVEEIRGVGWNLDPQIKI